MSTIGEIPSWIGFHAEDADGVPLGRVVAVHLPDARTPGTSPEIGLEVRLGDGSHAVLSAAGARRCASRVRLAVVAGTVRARASDAGEVPSRTAGDAA